MKTVWRTLLAGKETGEENNLVPVVKTYRAKERKRGEAVRVVKCVFLHTLNMMATSADQLEMEIKLFVNVAPHPL